MPTDAANDANFPVQLDVQRPLHYDRVQLVIRLLVCVSLGALQLSPGGALGLLYVLLPTVSSISISQRGSATYLQRDAKRVVRVLDWMMAFYAYLLFATDRFPLEDEAREVRLHVTPSGAPTLSDAVLRLLWTLPHALALLVLGIAAGCVSLVLLVCVLTGTRVPDPLYRFQRKFLVWLARVLAYHAALIDVYPPFSLGGAGPSAQEPRQIGPEL